MSGPILSRLFASCLLVYAGLLVAGQSNVQVFKPNGVLAPPRAHLKPVHWPDLSKLESDVRDHLNSLQNELSNKVTDPAATEMTLAEAYGAMGQIYQAYALQLPARECYLNASLLEPNDFRWIYLLGKIDQQEGQFEDAITRYLKARKLRPDYVAVRVNLGNAYLQLNRMDLARTSFNEALALETNNAASLYGLGQLALSERRYSEAVTYLEKALKQVPEATRIHYSLGMAYRGLGDFAKTRFHLAQRGTVGVRVADPLIDELPELIGGERLHLTRGRMAMEAMRFHDAEREFRKAVIARPNSVVAHLNLGTALMQTNDLTGAVAEFEEALRLDPRNANAQFNLAIVLVKQNKNGEAVAQLQSLLTVDPNDVDARLFLARELLKLERPEEALQEFSRVAQISPDNEEALMEEVRLLRQEKRYKQAVDRLEKSHAQYPQKMQTAATLAYLLAASPQYDLRDGKRALVLAQSAYQATGLPQYGAVAALAMGELGRCAEAADWQRKMIALAEQKGQTELLAKLTADLKIYEAVPCRPAGER
jgi:tetratricopeptide (TPR) repeat protein